LPPNPSARFNANAEIARWIRAAGTARCSSSRAVRTSDRGAIKRKGFCPACGVSIYNKPDQVADMIGIYVGSLDDASSFKPGAVFYAQRGYGWDFLDPDVPKVPEWLTPTK
jgi:hypothetical protein